MSAIFVDDHEEAVFTVSPSENVYSYFMFVTPTEQKKEGGSFTYDVMMAYFLVFLNFFMQGILLYTVFNEVVMANVDWTNGIMKPTKNEYDLFAPPAEKCNTGGSLCVKDGGVFSCAPPSVQLTGRWDELDTNGDGIWTYEEVVKARDALKCKYVVDPVEVFNVFVKFLLSREKILWIHPDLRAGKKIHKTYFTFAAGDIIMCGYRNEQMCPNLLRRGVFHAPLKHKTAPRVGTTIDSALAYCHALLKTGGMCERTLPSTYGVWKIASSAECGAQSFSKMVYKHPETGVAKSMLAVDYEARELYELSSTPLFMVYKTLVIGMWALAMLQELKDVVIGLTWCMKFPSADQFGADAVKEEQTADGETKYVIQGITSGHRSTVFVMNVARFFLALVLTGVGISFLLKGLDYVGLLMDAVALVFIVEISGILYGQVLRPEIREQCESLDPMTVDMYGIKWLNERQAIVDVIQLVGIVIFVVVCMHMYNTTLVAPLYDALECTCLSKGERCREADRFSYDFWHKYWKEDVPLVFKTVAKMKEEAGGALLQTAKSAASNILAKRDSVPAGMLQDFNRYLNWEEHQHPVLGL